MATVRYDHFPNIYFILAREQNDRTQGSTHTLGRINFPPRILKKKKRIADNNGCKIGFERENSFSSLASFVLWVFFTTNATHQNHQKVFSFFQNLIGPSCSKPFVAQFCRNMCVGARVKFGFNQCNTSSRRRFSFLLHYAGMCSFSFSKFSSKHYTILRSYYYYKN